MITTDNDYSYIEVFIKFLKEIFAMIQKIFTNRDVETGEALNTTAAKTEE